MYFSVIDDSHFNITAAPRIGDYQPKENLSSPNKRSGANDFPITSSDALPLNFRRLVGAETIKTPFTGILLIGIQILAVSRMFVTRT